MDFTEILRTHGEIRLWSANSSDDNVSALFKGLFEPIIAGLYTKITGNRIRKVDIVLQHADTDKFWMTAHIRHEVVGTPDAQVLNIFNVGESQARHWRYGLPIDVVGHCQQQLAVTGYHTVDVCVIASTVAMTILS